MTFNKILEIFGLLPKSIQRFFSKITPLDGHITITKVFPNGTRELVVDKQNLITLASKRYVLSSVYATSFTVDPVTQLQVGTGGTVDPEGLYPKPVTSDMTSLYNSTVTVSTSYTVNNDIPSVTFISDLDQGSGNGTLITECGLFRASGAMFNIKTFPGIPKTSEFSLHFEWTIKIS